MSNKIGTTLFKIVKNSSNEVIIREDYSREFSIIKSHDGLWFAYDDNGAGIGVGKKFKTKSEALIFTKNYIANKR